MKPLCDICSTRHESYQAHVFASNTASNKVTASNNASNAIAGVVEGLGVSSVRDRAKGEDRPRGAAVDSEVTRKQRWSRESYNAYQREYMKKRRAK